MRLLFRLSLTTLILLLILTTCYLILPSLLASYARYQLTQHGFSGIEIEIGSIGLQSTTVKRLLMSNDEFAIKLQGLQADYQLSKLLSGTVDSVQVTLYQYPICPLKRVNFYFSTLCYGQGC